MKLVKGLQQLWSVIWEAIVKFYEGNMLNYSASIAFFTIDFFGK